jgi:hypothetical protein
LNFAETRCAREDFSVARKRIPTARSFYAKTGGARAQTAGSGQRAVAIFRSEHLSKPKEESQEETVSLGTVAKLTVACYLGSTMIFAGFAIGYGDPGASLALVGVTVYTWMYPPEPLAMAYRWLALSQYISVMFSVVRSPVSWVIGLPPL